MMNGKKERLIRNELRNNLGILDKALDTFKYSYENCQRIKIKEEYTYEELDKFESLTSRFARISDILTQKILKSIFLLLREDVKTFIDRINLSEKLGIIASAEQLKVIRDLRNEIAHEYCIEDISDLFENVLNHSGILLNIIAGVKAYIETKGLIAADDAK
jgi:N-acetylglucosamine kinase-like BadF-type ATPase